MHPQVIGFQIHHSAYWDMAMQGLVSATQYLKSIEVLTGRPEPDLHQNLTELREWVARERTVARRALEEFLIEDPERYRRCLDGLEPWPDHDAMRFTGRCNCHDLCFHRFEGEVEEERYRLMVESPLFVCNCPDVRPPCPVPGHPVEVADVG